MKFLITGLGSIGQRHVRNLRQILGSKAEIGAYRVRKRDIVIDPSLTAKTGQAPEAYYGLRTFSSLEEALADRPDVVFITNPIAVHMETALAAARQGCHLFIEKPLSDRWEGIEELLHLVRQKNLVTCVAYNLRFHPGLKLVRKALQENRIGRICSAQIQVGEYLPGMHPYEDYRDNHAARRKEGGGVILCLSHEIDYALWLFGAPGSVSRYRTTSIEWHIMSLSTPPPCRSPRQNQGMCGPLCSSAARARYGRPASAAPRRQRISRPRRTAGAKS